MSLPKSDIKAKKPPTAGVQFAFLAGGFVLLFAAAVSWLALDQATLLDKVGALQSHTLPQTIDQQRLARNLEVLRLEGERVLFADTPEQRLQALFVVGLIANHPSIIGNARASTLANATERFLGSHIGKDDERAQSEWRQFSQQLTLLADDISVDGVNLGSTDLKAIEGVVHYSNNKLLIAVLLAATFIVSLLLLIRRSFIRPLQKIHEALIRLGEGTREIKLPAPSTTEMQTINSAIEKLQVAMAEKEAAQNTLRRRDQLLQEMGRTARIGAWELDVDSSHLEWTEEVFRVYEATPDFRPSLEAAIDFYAGESRTSIQNAMHQAIERGIGFELELQITTATGHARWVHVIGCIHKEEGRVRSVFGTVQDITERKSIERILAAAKADAERANEAKSRFLAAASHDLRQPLQAISLLNDALARTKLNDEQMHLMDCLSQSTRSLNDLLNALLDISKLDAGAVEAMPENVDVTVIFEKFDSDFSPVASSKSLRFILCFPFREMAILTDSRLLMSLLGNLIGNAIKYTPRGGVLVAVRRRGNQALFQVWDTGIGIAPEHLETIYQEYFQIGNPERDRNKGLGLGLAIVKRLATVLGTSVSCRSVPGKGSMFQFLLPLSDQTTRKALNWHKGSLEENRRAPNTRAHRLVLVEDDAMVALALKLSLESLGFAVTRYASAEEALANSDIAHADFYVCDFRLPGLNGVEFLKHISQLSTRLVKAVLVTGDTSLDRIEIKKSGRWPVLVKPIDLPSLLSAIELQDDSGSIAHRLKR
jgi:signal transduction histidine kinase/ActR/RegA family two-component response regulator